MASITFRTLLRLSHNMYDLTKRVIFLFIACNSVSANRWWRDTGYDLLDDSPEPIATSPPEDPYLNTGTPPLNATLGGGIYHLLVARQVRSYYFPPEISFDITLCRRGPGAQYVPPVRLPQRAAITALFAVLALCSAKMRAGAVPTVRQRVPELQMVYIYTISSFLQVDNIV